MPATVKILKTGFFRWVERPRSCEASPTCTLVRDGSINIIVDTGNIGEEPEIAKALAREGLRPDDVNYVVLTHWHADHVGCAGMFRNATVVDSEELTKNGRYDFYEGDYQLTPNAKIVQTPGHQENDCSVLVTTKKGIVAVVGDLFWRSQEEGSVFVKNEEAFARNREKIIGIADYIIPGHGNIFKVRK